MSVKLKNSVGFWFPYTPPTEFNVMALSMIVSAIREGSVSISKRRFVRIVLASQSKALLLPVYAIVDPCSDDFFDQELVKWGNRCLIFDSVVQRG